MFVCLKDQVINCRRISLVQLQMQQARDRELEVPCGVTTPRVPARCESPLPSRHRGGTGTFGGWLPCWHHGCAHALRAASLLRAWLCLRLGLQETRTALKLCQTVQSWGPGQQWAELCVHPWKRTSCGTWASLCSHFIVSKMPPKVPPAPFRMLLDSLVCSQVHWVFAKERNCLDMMSSWPASNLTRPWGGNHKPRRGLINKTFSLQEGKENT